MYSGAGGGDGSMFAGGGFMPSQSQANDFGGGGGRRSGSQNSGLLPLTAKMISQAIQKPSDENFYVDGVDVNNVTLVGMVHDKEERATDVSFQLDDTTGQIEVKRWIDGQEQHEMQEMNNIRNFTYVRVHGHLRSFQGKRNIVAFSVRPITDFNELTFHFLEVIYVHLSNIRAQGGTAAAPTHAGAAGVGPHGTATIATNPSHYNQYLPPASAMVGGNVDECQKRVHMIFEEPESLSIEQGLHIDQVAQRMVGYSRQQVKEAIEFLVNEGFVYSTIDDDHYKSTNG
ncbi:hypothetical protein CY35_08G048400 [Sphagnum magellanicum]|nr:hypothetical protein CY35_08G048400 [Sphagnum magellanicum]